MSRRNQHDENDTLAVVPWYWRDWRASKARAVMTLEARGVYRELLDACWGEADCSLPNDDATLAGLAGVSESEWVKVRAQVLAWFDESNGRISNSRAIFEWKKAKKFRSAKRVAGKNGGKAKAAKRLRAEKSASTASISLEQNASGRCSESLANSTSPSTTTTPSPSTTTTATTDAETATTHGPDNVRPFSPERRRLIAAGEAYLDGLCAADPNQDRGWLLRKHSLVPGSGAYMLALDAGSDKHLTRTVHNLRDAFEKLPRSDGDTRGGLPSKGPWEQGA